MKSSQNLLMASALAMVGILLLVFTVDAQQPTPSDNQVNALAKEMYCPVCENTPLDACPTQACAQWRDLIRQKMAQGWTDQQIKDYFVAQYGDRVLALPPARGLNWLIYILPPLIIIGGVFLLVRILKELKRRDYPENKIREDNIELPSDTYTKRIEEELSRISKS